MHEILKLAKPYWPRITAAVASSLVVSGSMGLMAWIIKDYIDDVLVEHQLGMLRLMPVAFFLLFTVKGVFTYIHSYLMRSTGARIVCDIRQRLFSHLIRMPYPFYQTEATGKLVSRIINDTLLIQNTVVSSAKAILVQGFTVMLLLGVAFYRSWTLTLISIVLMPAMFSGVARITRRLRDVTEEGQGRVADISRVATETFSGMKIVKAFANEPQRDELFDRENRNHLHLLLRGVRLNEMTVMLLDIVGGVGLAMVVAYGGHLAISGEMSPGDFVSYLAALLLVYEPLRGLAKVKASLEEASGAYSRISEFFLIEGQNREGLDKHTFTDLVRFESLGFRYPGEEIDALSNISLDVRRGQCIAIVGESGAGKTTLVDLIARFHAPTSGRILLDGTDLQELSETSVRDLIGMVSQDVFLFDDTVRTNIAMGRPGASDAEIEAAAQAAHAMDFIRRLPAGLDTQLGERGVRLSGGERQRISIARAILRDPPLLILDEATSALDSKSEREVQQALDALMEGRTTFVIAHRLSTVVKSDLIVVLDRGRIIEQGRHDELLKRPDSRYGRMWQMFITDGSDAEGVRVNGE